jgi:hypothetical protein
MHRDIIHVGDDELWGDEAVAGADHRRETGVLFGLVAPKPKVDDLYKTIF